MRRALARALWALGNAVAPKLKTTPTGEEKAWESTMYFWGSYEQAEEAFERAGDAACQCPAGTLHDGCVYQGGSLGPSPVGEEAS